MEVEWELSFDHGLLARVQITSWMFWRIESHREKPRFQWSLYLCKGCHDLAERCQLVLEFELIDLVSSMLSA